MTDLYENLLRATDNTADITTEKQGTVTKIQDKLCNVKEEATGLEHTNVPVINEVQVKEGDTVLLGFLDNNIYNPVVYGVIGRRVKPIIDVDNELSSTSENPVQNKIITSALNGKAGFNHTHLSEQILDLINVIYPVGSIYMSVNDVNPEMLFGGTWEQIEDKFLLASGTSYSNGATGGSATVTLTENEIPTHNHNSKTLTGTTRIQQYNGNSSTGIISQSNNNYNIKSTGGGTNFGSTTLTINATHTHDDIGGGQAHENMPPYLAVNVWKRIN